MEEKKHYLLNKKSIFFFSTSVHYATIKGVGFWVVGLHFAGGEQLTRWQVEKMNWEVDGKKSLLKSLSINQTTV